MRNLLKLVFVSLLVTLVSCKENVQLKDKSPRELYPGLFEAVQVNHLFPDSKTFPDCIPKDDPADILKEYEEQKGKDGFSLKAFLLDNFTLPEEATKNYKSDIRAGVAVHINTLWDVLKRQPDKDNQYSSLIALPQSYIVPGGRFREVYYWDSYFTMLGLEENQRVDLIENMVNNFAYLIRTYGFVPNGNRTYYLTRSQPPYFSLMVKLLMDNKKLKSDSVLNANKDALEREYHFWMDDKGVTEGANLHVVHLPGGGKLNRYYDAGNWPRGEAYAEDIAAAAQSTLPKQEVYRHLRSGAESGWDYSSRWLSDGKTLKTIHTTDIIPVDLNCLLYHMEMMLARSYRGSKDKKAEDFMIQSAEKRKNAIVRYCWDKESGWFRDYDWKAREMTPAISLAGVYPLFFNIASSAQADRVSFMIQRRFLKPGGLVTTLADTGQQWDAPNGWAPLQWMAIAGLSNYKKEELSREIAKRWSQQNIRVFNKTGKLLEKYNVMDTTLIAGGGEYPNQDGFGWTNGVLMKIMSRQKMQSVN